MHGGEKGVGSGKACNIRRTKKLNTNVVSPCRCAFLQVVQQATGGQVQLVVANTPHLGCCPFQRAMVPVYI